jgi:hypothetical protein
MEQHPLHVARRCVRSSCLSHANPRDRHRLALLVVPVAGCESSGPHRPEPLRFPRRREAPVRNSPATAPPRCTLEPRIVRPSSPLGDPQTASSHSKGKTNASAGAPARAGQNAPIGIVSMNYEIDRSRPAAAGRSIMSITLTAASAHGRGMNGVCRIIAAVMSDGGGENEVYTGWET